MTEQIKEQFREQFKEEICSSCKYDGYAQEACLDAWEGAPYCYEEWIKEQRQLVDELMYRSYVFNRQNEPEIAPEQWQAIFGKAVPEMEIRYQLEK